MTPTPSNGVFSRTAAKELLDDIEEVANASLAVGDRQTADERVLLEWAAINLRPSFDAIMQLLAAPRGIAKLKVAEPLLANLMRSIVYIGACAVGTDGYAKRVNKERGEQSSQTQISRNNDKPAEKALYKAIIFVRGDGPSEQPVKEAVSILGPVNERLAADGHALVSAQTIRRRLTK